MDADGEHSQAVTVMLQALDWAYDKATGAIPGLGSPAKLAENHLKSNCNSAEKAIDDLIAWQVGYAGAAGFALGMGGVITMPVAIPANLASSLIIQLRMIVAIAILRGYKVDDEQVKTMAFICLTGDAAAIASLKQFGIQFGMKAAKAQIKKIPGTVLFAINQAIGFRFVTRAGTKGLINLTKFVPFVGGIVGGTFDATMTRSIGKTAKTIFTDIVQPAVDEPSNNKAVACEQAAEGCV
jgi:uncharacterized protein (DUF697 family)